MNARLTLPLLTPSGHPLPLALAVLTACGQHERLGVVHVGFVWCLLFLFWLLLKDVLEDADFCSHRTPTLFPYYLLYISSFRDVLFFFRI